MSFGVLTFFHARSTEPAPQENTKMANKFVSFLESVGKEVEKGLAWAIKVAPSLDGLAAAVFPASVSVSAPLTLGLTLIQNAVILIEQKYAAAGKQNGTGAEKAAEVITLAGPAATQLLTEAGLPATEQGYIENIVNAVVGVLNAQSAAPAPAPAATPAA